MTELSDRIAANFQRLSQEEQEEMRWLRTDPEVDRFVALLQKIMPPEILKDLPNLRSPGRISR
jgi:hypothetical protein